MQQIQGSVTAILRQRIKEARAAGDTKRVKTLQTAPCAHLAAWGRR